MGRKTMITVPWLSLSKYCDIVSKDCRACDDDDDDDDYNSNKHDDVSDDNY